MKKLWKTVEIGGAEYQVSSEGELRSVDRLVHSKRSMPYLLKGKLLKGRVTSTGYREFHVSCKGQMRHLLAHRLVAEVFIPNNNEYPDINHLDGNKLNNHVSNLEWCTSSMNTIHAYKTGLMPAMMNGGDTNGRSKLDMETALLIREAGHQHRGGWNNFYLDLAEVFNISKTTVLGIVKRHQWNVEEYA